MSTIVVGFDGSDHGRRALERAIELARDGDSLAIVSAAKVSTLMRDPAGGASAVEPADLEEARSALDGARAIVGDRLADVHYVEGHGDPADILVQQAKDRNADLIVVGTRGLNVAQRVLLGSVSTSVVHNAHCDVLVVR
jgi:nucleotide-binding universal stress UspA family protein